MKTSLRHLPKHKQEELRSIAETIKKDIGEDAIVILFGSYARGDYVNRDIIADGSATYEYRSDYDLSVIVPKSTLKTADDEEGFVLSSRLESLIRDIPQIKTPTTIIVDANEFVEQELNRGSSFYKDVKQDGILLYGPTNFKLPEPKELTEKERKEIAWEDYVFWTKKAKVSEKHYTIAYKDHDYNKAAFELHQAVEAYFNAILLMKTGYKPKTHDLVRLEEMVSKEAPKVLEIFPKEPKEAADNFDMLCRAYVEARFSKTYQIMPAQLRYLLGRTIKLEELTDQVSQDSA